MPKSYIDQMIAHALEDDPNECCGIIAGEKGRAVKVYHMANPEHSPYRYSMDSRELFRVYREIEDNQWEVMVIYHSHTHSEAYPSQTDVRLATWPETHYVLVSLLDKVSPPVRAFRIVDGKITEAELRVEG